MIVNDSVGYRRYGSKIGSISIFMHVQFEIPHKPQHFETTRRQSLLGPSILFLHTSNYVCITSCEEVTQRLSHTELATTASSSDLYMFSHMPFYLTYPFLCPMSIYILTFTKEAHEVEVV